MLRVVFFYKSERQWFGIVTSPSFRNPNGHFPRLGETKEALVPPRHFSFISLLITRYTDRHTDCLFSFVFFLFCFFTRNFHISSVFRLNKNITVIIGSLVAFIQILSSTPVMLFMCGNKPSWFGELCLDYNKS